MFCLFNFNAHLNLTSMGHLHTSCHIIILRIASPCLSMFLSMYVWLFAIRRDRGVRGRVRLPTAGGLRAEYYPARLDRRALFSLPILHFALALYSSLVLRCFV
jgi:hypothetical protein